MRSVWAGLCSAMLLVGSCGDDGDGASSAGAGANGNLAANGAPCSDASACESGFCSDGLCCATACDGSCEGCATAGSEGTCVPAAAGTDTNDECESGSCDGSGACIGAVHVWSRAFPGAEIFPVVAAPDGSIVIAGIIRGTANLGGDDLVPTGNNDIFVARFTADGEHLWSKNFGGTGVYDIAYDLALDASGNIWVTGGVYPPVDFGGGSLGASNNKSDVFVLELDPMGNHLWSNVYGNIEGDTGHAIEVTADAVYLAGTHDYYVDFGGLGLLGPGFFLARLDLSGEHVWSDSFGLHKNDSVTPYRSRLAVAPDGSVMMTGLFRGTVDLGAGPFTSQNDDSAMFLASFDDQGNHVWSQGFATTSAEFGMGSDGRLDLVGSFIDSVDFGTGALTADAADGRNMYLAAFDAAGEPLWSTHYGDGGEDHASWVISDERGFISMVGSIDGSVDFGGGGLSPNGVDVFVARFTQDGTHLFSAIFGATGDEWGYQLAMIDDDLLVTGSCDDSIDLGGGTLDCSMHTYGAAFLARFSSSP